MISQKAFCHIFINYAMYTLTSSTKLRAATTLRMVRKGRATSRPLRCSANRNTGNTGSPAFPPGPLSQAFPSSPAFPSAPSLTPLSALARVTLTVTRVPMWPSGWVATSAASSSSGKQVE